MSEGVDFSTGRPGGAALVAAGKRFVIRYVPYAGDGGKGLTAAEIADYHGAGLGICLVYETTANRALGGRSAGLVDGNLAKTAAAGIGFPADRPIYFAVDFDMTRDQQATVDAYFGGCSTSLGAARVGIYGGLQAITHAQKVASAAWFWQTYAWSYGNWAAGIQLQQYANGKVIGGAAVDLDRAMVTDYGAWLPREDPMLDYKAEGWTVAAGVAFYDSPGGAQVGTFAAAGQVTTVGETDDNLWRQALVTTGGIDKLVYVKRADITPLVQGGDPAFNASVKALLISRQAPPIQTVTVTGSGIKLAGPV